MTDLNGDSAMRKEFLLLILLVFLCTTVLAQAQVTVSVKNVTIPTYEVGAPDPNPRFFEGRVYQGAQGRIYPYPISDKLTDNKVDRRYETIFMENDYIEISVIPELGGRLFTAVDKTNGYDFFYRQSVIKPSLIGMLGAWISGGIEWNIPHHHRANTYMPMTYTLEKGDDGSQTLWMTEIERRHRMKFLVGLTLYPDASYIEATIKFFNRTPLVHSFLYFANPAVHVDETYQVIFPPDTEYVTQHAKREFLEWPIGNGHYGGRDYENIDISWWKNLTKPVSFFCWNYTQDYFAGYDHGKDAGVAYVANHHIAPGKKFFTFGCGEEGIMWDKRLTDSDGPYLELMAGAYSDNQPDYSWIQPYETKTVKQYWYPIRNMEGMEYANLNGALNLRFSEDHTATIAINTTRKQTKAKLTVLDHQTILYDQTIDIAPDNPYTLETKLPADTQPEDVTIVLSSRDGQELLRYKKILRPGEAKPKPVTPPGKPESIKTNEELYLTGLRLNEFYNAQIDSIPYYREALERDPSDSRVNTQMGILSLKGGDFKKAEEYLQAAVDRLTANYTRPKTCEAHFYLGLALRFQDRLEAAYTEFYKATWDMAFRAAAYYQLAELDCLQQDFAMALHHIEESLAYNGQNTRALNIKRLLLAMKDKTESGIAMGEAIQAIDPLDYWNWSQDHFASRKNASQFVNDAFFTDMETVLELAIDYGQIGFYDTAISLLLNYTQESSPMLNYYLSYYYDKKGEHNIAKEVRLQAQEVSADYAFPYRQESIPVLTHAMSENPQDSLAPYLLGNLLFDHQPEKAQALWQKSIAMGNTYYMAHRNLGYAIACKGTDLDQAIAHYEKALALHTDNARIFYELDTLYESAGIDPQKRLALLHDHYEIVKKRDDSLSSYVILNNIVGSYDTSIDILTSHHFYTWEGGGSIHNRFVDAYLLRGIDHVKNGRFEDAMRDFTQADTYPDNLEVGRPLVDENAIRVYYYKATTLMKMDQQTQAFDHARKAIAIPTSDPEMLYYQAMCHQLLGEKARYADTLNRVAATAKRRLESGEETDFFAKFGEQQSHNNRLAGAHYLMGLNHLGMDAREEARQSMQNALEFNPNHVWARMYHSMLDS
jgi:tetratricopeptide (TPR) repeat protein